MEEIFTWESIKQFLIFLVIFLIAFAITVKSSYICEDRENLKSANLPYKKRRGECYCIDCEYYGCGSRSLNRFSDEMFGEYKYSHYCNLYNRNVCPNDSCKNGKPSVSYFPRSNSV